MSETTEVVTRRSRAERSEREVHREVEPAVEIEGGGGGGPEDALADTARQLRESNEQLAAQRRRTEEAERARREAEAQRDQAAGGRAQDRQTAVAAALESAKADGEAAALALRTAREAGDFDAEVQAQRRLNAADYRFNQAGAELEFLKNQPKPPPGAKPGGPSPAAQKWLDDHPRYHEDQRYRRFANGLHNEALQNGLADGSQSYVDYIERGMVEEFGQAHGRTPPADGGYQPERNERMSERRGDGVPPARGANGAGGNAGWQKVSTPLGEVMMMKTATGGRRYRMGDDVKENMREGAQLNRTYEKDPDQALASYVDDQVTMALEDYADDAGSYFKRGDGESYR